MRQLSLECGYSAASLRERIYANDDERNGPLMAGVLIYTAAPDSRGRSEASFGWGSHRSSDVTSRVPCPGSAAVAWEVLANLTLRGFWSNAELFEIFATQLAFGCKLALASGWVLRAIRGVDRLSRGSP